MKPLTREELEKAIEIAFVYDDVENFIAEDFFEYPEDVQREIWKEARSGKWFIFDEYRDKAGIGNSKAFDSKEKAIDYAEYEWHHLSDRDKKSYTEDAFSWFIVVSGNGEIVWKAFE